MDCNCFFRGWVRRDFFGLACLKSLRFFTLNGDIKVTCESTYSCSCDYVPPSCFLSASRFSRTSSSSFQCVSLNGWLSGCFDLLDRSIPSRRCCNPRVLSVTPNAIDDLCKVWFDVVLADRCGLLRRICQLTTISASVASFSIIDRRHVADDIHQIDQFLR